MLEDQLEAGVLAGATYAHLAHDTHSNTPSDVVSREREPTGSSSTSGAPARQSGMEDEDSDEATGEGRRARRI